MGIKLNQTYYYNNNPVVIIRKETDEFVLVQAKKSIPVHISGSQYCTACQIGGGPNMPPLTHDCDEKQDIIDEIAEELEKEDSDIFWVNVNHLKDKPIEFVAWEGIQKENAEIKADTKKEQDKKKKYTKKIEELQAKEKSIIDSIEEKEKQLSKIIEKLSDAEKRKIVLEDIPEIKINNSNLVIPMSSLLYYMKNSIKLEYLEIGGVDAWTYYGESLPDCEDLNEYLSNEALEKLAYYVK